MKKFFRVALVCALAGATLLYTGCTKDYSEDIHQLQQQVDNNSGLIKSLTEQVDALKAAKTALEEADRQANAAIDALKGRVSTLESTVSSQGTEIEGIKGQINTMKGQIGALETQVALNKAAIERIDQELAKKADKTYVDAELAKKADITWVEENYVTAKKFTEEIQALSARLGIVEKGVADLKDSIDRVNGRLGALEADVDELQIGLSTAMTLIDKAQKAADTAQDSANVALSETRAIWKALEAYATLDYVNGVKEELQKDYNKKLAEKVDTSAYNAKVAEINGKFQEIDDRFKAVIKAYKAADAALNKKIDSLDAAVTAALGTKVDTADFNAYAKAIRAELDGIRMDLDKVLNRVQSLVYVPEYDDHQITVNWAVMEAYNPYFVADEETIPASFTAEWDAWAEKVAENANPGELDLDWLLTNKFNSNVIVEPFHVKYRVYGKDAAATVKALVKAVNDDPDQAFLAFDAVRIKTRTLQEGDDVDFKIVAAEVDDLNADVIDLTVEPVGLPDYFYAYYWIKKYAKTACDVGESVFYYIFNNLPGSLKRQVLAFGEQVFAPAEEPTELQMLAAVYTQLKSFFSDETSPAFSLSLVLTDAEQSRFITSGYNNAVPAQKPDVIDLQIWNKEKKDVSWKMYPDYADVVKIEYSDKDVYEVLEDHQLMFVYNGEPYTPAKFEEKFGLEIGQIVFRADTTKMYEKAIDASKLTEVNYIDMSCTDGADGVCEVKTWLNEVNRYGVGAEEEVVVYYFVGRSFIATTALVKVMPIERWLDVDLWETETQEAFKWDYTKDAATDAAIKFEGLDPKAYNREGAVAKIAPAALAFLQEANIFIDDFKQKEPDPAVSFIYTYRVVDGAEVIDTLCLADLLVMEQPKLNIYPYFDEDVLKANVTNFEFAGVTKYVYDAIYKFPSNEEAAALMHAIGTIKIDDRNREPIVITLPETVKDIEVNMYVEAKDSLFDAAGNVVPTVETSLEDHHLAKADVTDAFGRVETRTWGLFQVNDPTTTTAVLYAPNSKFNGQAGYYANERLDYVTMDLGTATDMALVATTDLARNNTTAHTETEYLADEANAVNFRTTFKVDAFDLRNKFIGDYADYTSYLTLWYGQDVVVKKHFQFNNDGIFDYERIPEYVTYNGDEDCFTTLQPLWQPDGSTTDFSIPVTSYDASKVLLNQHFRIVDVLNDKVVTDLKGNIKEDYSYLRRQFWLENAEGKKVTEIADPRNFNPDWKVIIDNALTADTPFNEEPNILSYYSKAPQTDVYGDLYIFNNNGSFMVLKTRFDRKAGDETYENYVIKLYDPLLDLKLTNDNEKQLINVNNSIMTVTSIYEFLTLKDKRQKELIDAKTANGWVIGNNTNGFATGVTTDQVYSLSFTHEMEYLTEVSPETKARISFDEKTGKLTYDNTLQTQLANPIDIKLAISVEYPWGTRTADVVVEFYNKPVGE